MACWKFFSTGLVFFGISFMREIYDFVFSASNDMQYDDQIVKSTFKKSVLPGCGLYSLQATDWYVGRNLSLKYAVHLVDKRENSCGISRLDVLR